MDPLDSSQESQELSEYILSATLPECVSVIRGRYTSKSVQITKGNIILLKSCEAKVVTLTYRDKDTGARRKVNVSTDCPQKFTVLPPKESVSSRAVSIISYPTILDLLIDSPTYFEATSSYYDGDIYASSIKGGDRFRLMSLMVTPQDGQRRLRVEKEGQIIFLNLDCKGNFFPLEDDQPRTLRELISFAPVPRRLKLVKKEDEHTRDEFLSKDNLDSDSENTIGFLDTVQAPSKKNDALPDFLPRAVNGIIHMLKPDMTVVVNPLNDPDTVWTIPLSANIFVREYSHDDYEVPASTWSKQSNASLSISVEADELPNFPAPSMPPITQPLVPINVSNFYNIYIDTFPLKAQIMDLSECNSFYKKALHDYQDLIIHGLKRTSRVYAHDEKADLIYSLSKQASVSFIEYPQNLNSVSELVNLDVGTKVVVLEDIMSDFPKNFTLQIGDIIRTTSNVPVLMKVKHTNLECQILKCERINQDGGSITKLKLPLDFDVKMIISKNHTDQQVITVQDLTSRRASLPTQTVAALIDEKKNKELKNLPPNLQILEVLPERLLLASLPQGDGSKEKRYKYFGISLNSNVVLAFRKKFEYFDFDKVMQNTDFAEQPMEILTPEQYEQREKICLGWMSDEKQEVESISSSEKHSATGGSLDRASEAGSNESKGKRKPKDKMRRLSRALNPKHWRMSKTTPDPLPHPEAMGLMALAVRPHYEKSNDYQEKLGSHSSLDQTMSSVGNTSTSDEDEAKNIYEDVDIKPLNDGKKSSKQTHKSKPFSGPYHKSLPMPRITSRSHVKRVKEKASYAVVHKRESDVDDVPKTKPSAKGSIDFNVSVNENGNKRNDEEYDDDHIYEFPDGSLIRSRTTKPPDLPNQERNHYTLYSPSNSLPEHLYKASSSHSSLSLPQSPQKWQAKRIGAESERGNSPIEYSDNENNSKKISHKSLSQSQTPDREVRFKDPPIPPRRTKKNDALKRMSSHNMPALPDKGRFSLNSGENLDEVDWEEKNTSKEEQPSKNEFEKLQDNLKAPIPKPRGLKKRAFVNLETNYIEKGIVLMTGEKCDDNSSQDSILSEDKNLQSESSLYLQDPAQLIMKPKPPPKPILKPR